MFYLPIYYIVQHIHIFDQKHASFIFKMQELFCELPLFVIHYFAFRSTGSPNQKPHIRYIFNIVTCDNNFRQRVFYHNLFYANFAHTLIALDLYVAGSCLDVNIFNGHNWFNASFMILQNYKVL